MKKKIGSLLVFSFSCLILSGFIMNIEVKAVSYNGNGASEAYAASKDCSTSPTFNNGTSYCQYNNSDHKSIKVSLYYFDGKSRTKYGESIYFTCGGKQYLEGAYASKDETKISVVNQMPAGIACNKNTDYSTIKSNLESYYLNATNNYSNLRGLIWQLGVDINNLTKESQPADKNKVATKGYRILIEPVLTSIDKQGNRYAFTPKYWATLGYDSISNTKHWNSSGRGFATLLFTEFKDVGINNHDRNYCNGITSKDYIGILSDENSGCGYNIIDISNTSVVKNKQCDINVNNNTGDDKKYNWTYWDASCDADGDGIKEGCWKKQVGGCCDQVTLTDDILNRYPECGTCKPSNKTYINGKNVSSLNAIACDKNDKKITNYRGTGNLNQTTPKYCLANNSLLMGIINGKRYGCEVTDSLLLPKEYSDDLAIGQHFVWPTSETLQSLGNFDMRYPVTRTSNVTCVAYTYTADGKLQYVNLTSSELATLKKRFKVSGNLNLTFNGNSNGKIIEETQSSDFKNTSNNLFTGNINTIYTLEKINKTNGVYAYYDQEKLQYTNTIIIDKINKYIQYGFPIIPLGNYGEKNVNIKYGINFEEIGLSHLKSYSGSYICSKNGNDGTEHTYCKCEPGTIHEGLDLTPYFNSIYDSWAAECSRIRDLKCDVPDTPIKCPNDNSKDMTNCVRNKIYGGSNEKEAYDLCVAHNCGCSGNECNPGYCTGKNCGIDIIYRPIFLTNPFPSIKAIKRAAGANWGGKNSLNVDGLGTKYITSTASKMYQGEAMYSFTLTPKALIAIKKYNDSHGYDDFEMNCGNNQYCISKVLRGEFSEYFTGGTCQLQTNAKIRGKNDCRLKALER